MFTVSIWPSWGDSDCEHELNVYQQNLLSSISGGSYNKIQTGDFNYAVLTSAVEGINRSVILVQDNQIKRGAGTRAKRNLAKAFPYVVSAPFLTKVGIQQIRGIARGRRLRDGYFRDVTLSRDYENVVQLNIPGRDTNVESWLARLNAYILPNWEFLNDFRYAQYDQSVYDDIIIRLTLQPRIYQILAFVDSSRFSAIREKFRALGWLVVMEAAM